MLYTVLTCEQLNSTFELDDVKSVKYHFRQGHFAIFKPIPYRILYTSYHLTEAKSALA